MDTSIFGEKIHINGIEPDVWKTITNITEMCDQEEAFYVCNIDDIVWKYEEWKRRLPRVYPYYAVKCNDHPTVLKVLAALGTGFDCASKAEISKVLELGLHPQRIIFANSVKQASHIEYAAAKEVDILTFDNEIELHKVKHLFPTARLLIRILCKEEIDIYNLGEKFGANMEDACHLLKVASKMQLDVVGVSFHVGCSCQDPKSFKRAIAAARDVFDYATSLGYQFTLLDIGGGYPGDKGSNFNEFADCINMAINDYFPFGCGVKIIAEPGQYFVASAWTLATNIYSIREVLHKDDSMTYKYYLNDGIYGSFNIVLFEKLRVKPVPLKSKKGRLCPSSFWGPTCDGRDQILENILFPKMNVGDWVIFENMGAYSWVLAGNFNGFPVSKVCMVTSENTWLMLKNSFPLTDDLFIPEKSSPTYECI